MYLTIQVPQFLKSSSQKPASTHENNIQIILAPKDKQSKPDKKTATYSESLGYDYIENFKNRFELAKTLHLANQIRNNV